MKKNSILFGAFLFAATAVNAQTSLLPVTSYSWQISQLPREFNGKLQFGFVSGGQGFPSYGTVLAGGGYNNTQDGASFQLYFPYSNLYGGVAPKIRLGSYNNQGWSEWQSFYTSANANNETTDWTAKSVYVIEKLGIGTTSPKEALSVKGKIFAQEIKVTTAAADWPDYVFAEGYKLPSLKETAKFIEENKHLPGVPKAAEIEENGLSLGEMNRILMQKVEELTLHMIDKDRRIEALEKKLNQKGQN
ncbi:hypothetical protein D3C87_511210 [compost metagenome]